MKMNGALLAKGWLLGLQFHELLKDGVYFDICANAVRQAERIQAAFNDADVEEYIHSQSNQIFVVLSPAQVDALKDDFFFELDQWIDSEHALCRFCTAWYTSEDAVDALVYAIIIL